MRSPMPVILACVFASNLLLAGISRASAPPPIVPAGTSPDGRYLVVAQYDLAPATGPASGRQILSTTFSIQTRSLAAHLAAYPYWLTETCHLTISGEQPGNATFWWPLVNNTGDTLVLVAPVEPDPTTPALRIYHCAPRQVDATSVREVRLADLWTTTQINPSGSRIIMHKGDKPPWFAGGSLTFTPDSKSLVYRSQWHTSSVINLATGAVHPIR